MAYNIRQLKSACAMAATVYLVGCMAVPETESRPAAIALSEQFIAPDGLDADSQVDLSNWWTSFDDSLLDGLIAEALAQNTQLDVARANVETARTILARQSLNRQVATGTSSSVGVDRAARPEADTEVSASGSLGASWELDLFGRIDAAIQSATFDLEAAEEFQRDVAVLVAGETALAYVNLRGGQIRLNVAQQNADLQGDSLDLLQSLFDNGRATRLDVERAISQYRTTRASLPVLQRDIDVAAAGLATLTGHVRVQDSPVLVALLRSDAAIPQPPAQLAVGTPDDLVRRRPDIRQAEANIASALALSEVERARLFPTLSFSANVLAVFNDTNDFNDSFGFGIGPSLQWDGPDLRRVRADIDLSDARVRAAFATYENTVLQALGDVEIALATYVNERARQADLEAAADAANQAEGLARLRFEEGVDDFLDVIDAQRTLLDAQDRLEQHRLNTTRAAIGIYRSLGGIWDSDTLMAAAPAVETE